MTRAEIANRKAQFDGRKTNFLNARRHIEAIHGQLYVHPSGTVHFSENGLSKMSKPLSDQLLDALQLGSDGFTLDLKNFPDSQAI